MTNPTPNSLCPQGKHAPGPEPLSPAAEALHSAILAIATELEGQQ